MEQHFRRTMTISRGDYMTFVERPISAVILLLALLVLGCSIWSRVTKVRRAHELPTRNRS